MQRASAMPKVQRHLSHGGRHYDIFRDSLVQRSLILRGTAAITRIQSEDIETDRITVHSARSTTSALTDLTDGSNLMTENAVKTALDLVPYYTTTYLDSEFSRMTAQNLHLLGELANYSNTAAMNSAISTALSSYYTTTYLDSAFLDMTAQNLIQLATRLPLGTG